MSTCVYDHAIKIEPGQILDPDSFPPPNELVCVQIPKVFDQVALRNCITRDLVLVPGKGVCKPVFSFEGADDFCITEVKVISKTDSYTKPGFKKLKLSVKIKYNIYYSDGVNQLKQPDEATFFLTINEIYCPNCFAQTGVTRFPKDFSGESNGTTDDDGMLIKVEVIAEVFNDVISFCTGAFILDIGVFFVVKCECIVQLLIPAFGYCPVPPEQQRSVVKNCKTFNDKTKTLFPTQIFPNQKWNPLDK